MTVHADPGKFSLHDNIHIESFFNTLGADTFERWDFEQSTWVAHSIEDLLEGNSQTAAHFLLRLTGVARMPAVYEMIPVLESHVIPVLESRAIPVIQAKGKEVDRDE